MLKLYQQLKNCFNNSIKKYMKSKYSRTQYKEEFDIDTATVIFVAVSIGKLILLAYQVCKLYNINNLIN